MSFRNLMRYLPGMLALVLGAVGTTARDRADPADIAALASGRPEDYRLAPRDQVVFEMFNEPALKTTQRLTARGELTLPMIGTVPLSGLSLREAEVRLGSLYRERGYFVDPQVMLAVAEYGERFVTILGQVARPARIPLPIETNSIGVLEGVTQAGGFTRIARTDAVQVTRRGADGTDETVVVDVRAMLALRTREVRGEFQLQPGDVVFVPERVF